MAKKGGTYSLGADPEFMLVDPGTNLPVPAWMLTKGTKEQNESISPRWSIHADNVALEMTMAPSLDDHNHFQKAIRGHYAELSHYAEMRGYVLKALAFSKDFTEEHLKHPLAQRLGCDPDFDAYKDEPSIPRDTPVLADMEGCRFFGGHIHVGYDRGLCPPHVMARLLDVVVGLRFLGFEKQGPRRKFYGQAGLFRPKPYGIEYRTPSNFWVISGQLSYLAANIASLVQTLADNREFLVGWYKQADWGAVKELIDKEQEPEGMRFFNEFKKAVGEVSHHPFY